MFRMQPTSSPTTPSVWALAWVLLSACGGSAAAEGQRTAGSDGSDTGRDEGSADDSSESDGSGSGDAVSEDTGDDASDGAGSGGGAPLPQFPLACSARLAAASVETSCTVGGSRSMSAP